MLNMISMNFYRVFKSKSTWILLIISAAMMVFTVFAFYYQQKLFQENPEFYQQYQDTMAQVDESGSAGVGVTVQASDDLNHVYTVMDAFVATYVSNIPYILMAIFAVLLVNGEHATGFVKNIAGQLKSRGMLLLSKLPAMFAFAVVLMLVQLLFAMAATPLAFGYFHFGDVSDFLQTAGLQLLGSLTFSILAGVIATLIRNAVVPMVLAICGVTGVAGLVYGLITTLLVDLFDLSDKFALSNYTVTGSLPQLVAGTPSDALSRAVIVCVVWLAVSLVVSVLVNRRRDL